MNIHFLTQRIKKILAAVIIPALFLCFNASPLYAAKTESDKLDEQREDIREEQTGILRETAEIESELSAITADLSETADEYSLLSDELRYLSDRRDKTLLDYEDTRVRLSRSINYLYKHRGIFSLFHGLFSSHSLASLINYPYYVSKMTGSLEERLVEYETVLNNLEEINKELEQKQADLKDKEALLEEKNKDTLKELKKLGEKYKKNDQLIKKLTAEMERLEREAMEEEMNIVIKDPSNRFDPSSGNVYSNGEDYFYEAPFECSEEDAYLLACLIQSEAGNQTYAGKVAVGSVVLNRVYSSLFPNTIPTVIYQKGQFYPYGSGRLAVILAEGCRDDCMVAARDVLAGKRNVTKFFYRTASCAAETGITGIQIGDHVFHDL